MTAGSETVILQGGPMHRRVYFADEVPRGAPYRDSGRYAAKSLGEIYSWLGKGVDGQLRDVVPRVWEWTGTAEPSLTARAQVAGGFARTCTRLGCEERAVVALAGDLERKPWYACKAHQGPMTAALAVGRPTGYSVDPTPI